MLFSTMILGRIWILVFGNSCFCAFKNIEIDRENDGYRKIINNIFDS